MSNEMDAQLTTFFQREIEYVKTQVYNTKHRLLQSFMLFPINAENYPDYKKEIVIQGRQGFGNAKIMDDYAGDSPTINETSSETNVKVAMVRQNFVYTEDEVRLSMETARLYRRNEGSLDARLAMHAKEAIEQKMDSIAWLGDSEYNLNGFINFPGISEYTVPNDGTASSKEWEDKTAANIIRDVLGLIGTVTDNTGEVEQPDTLLVPPAQYNLLMEQLPSTNETILSYLMRTQTQRLRGHGIEKDFIITSVPRLTGAGSSSADRMMTYVRDPKNVEFIIPKMFTMKDPQPKNMAYKVECYAKTAGVYVYYPASVAFGDGI